MVCCAGMAPLLIQFNRSLVVFSDIERASNKRGSCLGINFSNFGNQAMGLEKDDTIIQQLGLRWQKGKAVLHPSDPTLQTKEIPLEVFFHKIVGVRNQLRVLEQKINAHEKLSDGEKVEMQQYISRCYGSLTTFNLLFKNKEDQFSSKGEV